MLTVNIAGQNISLATTSTLTKAYKIQAKKCRRTSISKTLISMTDVLLKGYRSILLRIHKKKEVKASGLWGRMAKYREIKKLKYDLERACLELANWIEKSLNLYTPSYR